MKVLLEDVEKRVAQKEIDNEVKSILCGNRTDGGSMLIVWLTKRLTQYTFKIVYEQFNDVMHGDVSS